MSSRIRLLAAAVTLAAMALIVSVFVWGWPFAGGTAAESGSSAAGGNAGAGGNAQISQDLKSDGSMEIGIADGTAGCTYNVSLTGTYYKSLDGSVMKSHDPSDAAADIKTAVKPGIHSGGLKASSVTAASGRMR